MATIDTTPSTIATNALQALPFGSIIGGPLKACIDAQATAAQTTWEFIQNVGLTDDGNGGKKAIYVNFEYRKDGRLVTLTLPLLTIVPIPYMAIRDIDIAFKANISAAASTSETKRESFGYDIGVKAKTGFNIGFANGSLEMSANISSKKDSAATRDSKYSVEYTMDVAVKAGQDDMPAGMAKVLELLSESIDTVDTRGELRASEQVLSLGNGASSTFISYKNKEGYYEPQEIKIFKYANSKEGSEPTDTECQKIIDDSGLVCTFKTKGCFLAKAGDRQLVIVVNE